MSEEVDMLAQRVAALEAENAHLKALLVQHGVVYESSEEKPEEVTVQIPAITAQHAKLFYSFFRGRKDVYAKRNVTREGKAVYYPVCEHFWVQGRCPRRDGNKTRCMDCAHRQWTPLSQRVLMRHLIGASEEGRDVLGVYPLLENETCHFLVFDFDHHEEEAPIDWQGEVDTLRRLCQQLSLDVLVERSRSGNGAHVWLFFEEAIPAWLARRFGACLLTRGAQLVNQKSFLAYDRMLPAQDKLPEGGLGNLIALPLQGRALREGNSAFVDENWRPYPDQWAVLQCAGRLSEGTVREYIKEWGEEGEVGAVSRVTDVEDTKPWKPDGFVLHGEDVDGALTLVESCMLYVRTDNLKPRLCNTLRRLASFSNPLFYRNKAMGLSVKGLARIVTCYDEDELYIGIPRGKSSQLLELCQNGNVNVHYRDIRNKGRKIAVRFQVVLYPEQQKAADAMLAHDTGILQAATAFGKTAVGAYLIAARQVNTLVLVHNREILKNWVDDLQKFLQIDAPLPEYTTASGRTRRRRSHIGRLFSAHCSVGGLVDVAMITSLGSADNMNPIVREYGMVLMDECHHAAAYQANCVLNRVHARYVYGLTATPKRDDGMEQKVLMAFGPVRYRYTAKQRAESRNVRHLVYPRFTRFCTIEESRIHELYRLLVENETRNRLIINDVLDNVAQGHTPLVLTKFKTHAEYLVQALEGKVQHIFLLQGGRTTKEREEIRGRLLSTPAQESVVVVAIGQYIGEGFNYPRLDRLMLTVPIAWQGNVEQYAGRLHRDYEGKEEVVIYDYADVRVRVFDRMYSKRLRAYKRIGYSLFTPMPLFEQEENRSLFYEGDSFVVPLEDDILDATEQIVISSPAINRKGVLWLVDLCRQLEGKACRVSVVTLAASVFPEREEEVTRLLAVLENAGVSVHSLPSHHEHFAVIDRRVVWYGNANFLSMRKESDNVLRLESPESAAEFLCLLNDKMRE